VRGYWRSHSNEASRGFPFPLLLRAVGSKEDFTTRLPNLDDKRSFADMIQGFRDGCHTGSVKIEAADSIQP
jgi:hypothetical protein